MSNEGSLTKSGGTGTSEIGVTFNQTGAGTTAVPSGTLSLTGGGSDSGRFAVSGGATLSLGGAFTLGSTSQVSAINSTLNLGDSGNAWSNHGTITATSSTVNLGGDFTLAALGSFARSGGTVNLTGTLDNTGTTLALTAATGSWDLLGGTLKGGTVTEAGGAELAFTTSGGTLAGVTFNNDLDLASVYGANATVTGGLTLHAATVHLGNAAGSTYGALDFNGTQALGGTGTVLFGKSTSNSLNQTASAATLTLGSGITVRGSSGSISGYYSNDAVVNQGTITADDSGGLTPPFVYDTGFSGGGAGNTADAIAVAGVTSPAPQAVYQTFRQGSFSYTLTGLTPSASYTLRLHFADPYSTAAGQRQFNVSINGTQVLTNFDIFAAAGGQNKAVVESQAATADAQGQLAVSFAYGAAGTPLVNGLEVDSGNSIVQAINSGELAGGTLTINPATFTNPGTLQAQDGDDLAVTATTWTNQGTVEADSGSIININGSVTLAPTSQINVEVRRTTPGGFGSIVVSGAAALNGTLNVVAGAGFTLNAGDAIHVMTFASHTDNFVKVTGTSSGRHAFFVETVSDTAVTLTAAVSAEDLAASTLVVPATGTAGQDAIITYTVDNISNVTVTGD
jgi:hypothetical protein